MFAVCPVSCLPKVHAQTYAPWQGTLHQNYVPGAHTPRPNSLCWHDSRYLDVWCKRVVDCCIAQSYSPPSGLILVLLLVGMDGLISVILFCLVSFVLCQCAK